MQESSVSSLPNNDTEIAVSGRVPVSGRVLPLVLRIGDLILCVCARVDTHHDHYCLSGETTQVLLKINIKSGMHYC